jgi:chorismate--pyruvate lyase
VPHAWRRWLNYPDSLTRRLEKLTQQPIKVKVLQQALGPLLPDEKRMLRHPLHRHANLREVCLMAGSTPLVVARTVWPQNAPATPLLAQLGNRPLGELLFKPSSQQPSAVLFQYREYSHIQPNSKLYALAQSAQTRRQLHSLWARKTLYQFYDQPLVVTEIFLPFIKHL